MREKKKLVLCIYGLAGFLALFLILKFILNSSYRNQLPEYPDFNNISKSLKEQISDAGRMQRSAFSLP
jgi:hypothetical protein